MNIFERIATFLLRLLAAWAIYIGLDALVWYELYHFRIWTPTQDYSVSWAIAGLVKLTVGVLLFVFSRRLGRLFGGDLGQGGDVA
jgi:hypothetical protein